MLTSTANDQLSEFGLTFNTLTLTNKNGNTTTLLTAPQSVEFVHLNGTSEPLVTATIPQGVYTSATANIGYAYFTCMTIVPQNQPNAGGLDVSTYAYGQTPSSQVTVNLASPLTVSGQAMALALDLQVLQSATYDSCYPVQVGQYSINPTFNLHPVSLSSQPANSSGTMESALEGQVSSVDAGSNSLELTLADSTTVTLHTNSSTVYQGISGVAEIGTGAFLTADATLQPDGSNLATLVSVEDPTATGVSTLLGPVMQTGLHGSTGVGPVTLALGTLQQGFFAANHEAAVWMQYDISSANFEVFDEANNLSALPFVPSFNVSNMVPGQNVYITTDVAPAPPFLPLYLPASTLTLMPQVINGTVVGTSSTGGFQVYTVSLAPYALFPTLAGQPVQIASLTDPNNIQVYVDSNTKKLNLTPLAVGDTLRFRGLVFNDNGILRMDCTQVSDGVVLAPSPNPGIQLQAGRKTISRGQGQLQRTFVMRP